VESGEWRVGNDQGSTPDDDELWKPHRGIYVIIEVREMLGERIHELQRRVDPKLANHGAPHLTLVGSSGLGPINARTNVSVLRDAMAAIAESTAPFSVALGRPTQFMQTDIVVLPLDPHGALRALHERVGQSGLTFARARFAFTPHVTLSFYRTLGREQREELLAFRASEPLVVDHLVCTLTDEPSPRRRLFDLDLNGGRTAG
jgi:2'-5' RNA ligase